jgi:hypothetical protein
MSKKKKDAKEKPGVSQKKITQETNVYADYVVVTADSPIYYEPKKATVRTNIR